MEKTFRGSHERSTENDVIHPWMGVARFMIERGYSEQDAAVMGDAMQARGLLNPEACMNYEENYRRKNKEESNG